jgi:hypothetical protein
VAALSEEKETSKSEFPDINTTISLFCPATVRPIGLDFHFSIELRLNTLSISLSAKDSVVPCSINLPYPNSVSYILVLPSV